MTDGHEMPVDPDPNSNSESNPGATTSSPPSSIPRQDEIRPRAKPKSFNWLCSPPHQDPTPFQQAFLEIDWTTSAVGPISQWPPWLKQMVFLVMGDPKPSLLYVDDENGDVSAVIYNEALSPQIGEKHPSLQGRDPRIGFAEIWGTLDDIFIRGREHYETIVADSQPLLLRRHGFSEETFWSWRFNPVLDPEGIVRASYVTCSDDTTDIIAARRSAILEAVELQIASAQSLPSLWAELALALNSARKDLPCAFIFSHNEGHLGSLSATKSPLDLAAFRLRGSTEGTTLEPAREAAELGVSSELGEVIHTAIVTNKPQTISGDLVPAHLAQAFRIGPNDELCEHGVVLPIVSSFLDKVYGFILISHNPQIALDDGHWTFLSTIVKTISSAANHIALQEQLSIKTEDYYEIQAKYHKLASRAPVGVASFTPDGTLVSANDYWYRLTQCPSGPGGDPLAWTKCVSNEDRDIILRAWNQVSAEKEEVSIQLKMLTPRNAVKPTAGDSNITVLCSVYPDLDDKGNVLSIMSCITDVSNLKELEERLRTRTREVESHLEDVLRMKQQQETFIDMTCHEIRNPLSAVLHLAEEIYATSQDSLDVLPAADATRASQERNMLATETIIACVLHQKRVVDDILVVSRIDSDLLHVNPTATQVRTAVKGCLKFFDAEVRAHSISLSLIEDASLHNLGVGRLMLDPNRVTQILINLVGNAIKFTKTQKKRTICVNMMASLSRPSDTKPGMEYVPVGLDFNGKGFQDDAGEVVWLGFSVRDSGRGLSPAEKQQLLQRFQQPRKKTYTEYGGSGMGLWIAKQLAELQGGQIGFGSEQGKGSDFRFFIRTTRVDNSEPNLKEATAASTVLAGGTTRAKFDIAVNSHKPPVVPKQPEVPASPNSEEPFVLLVVEDNVVNQRVLAQQLRKKGCIAHIANHGAEALEFLRTTKFWAGNNDPDATPLSLVLMDIEMPVMNGITATREIRGLQRSGKLTAHIPILAVTANARREQHEEMLEAGMDDSITKPYRITELMTMIRDIAHKYSV